MAALIPAGTIATPYGVSVPVMRDPCLPADSQLLLSAEATAICAGIYDLEQRRRFIADAKTTKRFDFERFGGGKAPKVVLPRPEDPVYPRMPGKDMTPVEAWTTRLMDLHRWCDRADALLEMIGDNLEQEGANEIGPYYAQSLCLMMTAALEHLGETEIGCLEAAAFYALSMHQEWVDPAEAWLLPVQETWFRDWRAARSRYSAFVRALAEPLP